jgi:zinc/manganese transport system permease protein
MFSGLMLNTWVVATMVAIVAGVVGFFVVLRGSSFVAHALPNGAFAGAAGASLLGINTIFGLGAFALLGALGIGWLGRRARHDVATALALVVMLGLGALFLSMSVEYAPDIYSLLFGEILGVSVNELLPTAVLGAICVGAIVVLYRPLMLVSVMAEVGEARGVRSHRMEMYFLVVVALATTMTVPVVGALLMFSLMVGPAGAARSISSNPGHALGLSVLIALATVWLAITFSYFSNWPIGFFVGVLGAAFFITARGWAAGRRGRVRSSVRAVPDEFVIGGEAG